MVTTPEDPDSRNIYLRKQISAHEAGIYYFKVPSGVLPEVIQLFLADHPDLEKPVISADPGYSQARGYFVTFSSKK